MYVVILAGGGGTRLWPLSSAERPKPFLPLLGSETLLQRTVHRLFEGDGLADGVGLGDVTVVTDRRYAGLVKEQLPGVRILAEPAGRNTAAAITLAVAAIERPDDEVMLVLPADHWISKEGLFRAVLADAEAGLARNAFGIADPLVTMGIQITRPATEYGYLIPELEAGGEVHGLQGYPLKAFVEKPDAARANELFHQPGVAWNAGIFLWQRRAIRDALETFSALFTLIGSVAHSEMALPAAYEQIRPISIDYALMEPAARAGRVVMGAMNVGWSDLGSWGALLSALGIHGIEASVIQPGESALVGPEDLTIESAGDRAISVPAGRHGTITAHVPIALLRGARAYEPEIDALLDRCSRWES